MTEVTGNSGVKTKESKPRLPDGREAYIFDGKKFDKRTGEFIDNFREGGRLRGLTISLQSRDDERIWAKKFSRKIPKDWVEPQAGSGWHQIDSDIQNPKVKLTDDEIIAVAEYPIWHVPYSLGMHRALNFGQLKTLAEEMKGPPVFDEIIKQQVKLGKVTQKEVDEANAIHNNRVRQRLGLPGRNY